MESQVYTSEDQAISDFVATALEEVGYHEKSSASNLYSNSSKFDGSANFTKYSKELKEWGVTSAQGDYWCDQFVDWVFVKTFGKTLGLQLSCQSSGASASAATSESLYVKAKRWSTKPKVGDQVFFYARGKIGHTGIVYKVTISKIYTVEGNSSNQVTKREYSISDSRIHGYGHPDYSKCINKQRSSTNTKSYSTTSSGSDGSYNSSGTSSPDGTALQTIDPTKIVATVLTLDESTYNLNISKLKSLNVLGLFLPGGYTYDNTHQLKNHIPSHIYDQVYYCMKNKLIFGLIYKIRSRNVIEAEKECSDMYYLISRYPPGMGLWLKLEFPDSQSKTTNNRIIDTIYSKMTSWGITNGCGIYADNKSLDKIDWKKYQDKFLLWYINHFTSDGQFNEVDELMNPEFFRRS